MRKISPILLLFSFFYLTQNALGQSLFEKWFPSRSVTFESYVTSVKKKPHNKGTTAFFNISWPLSNQVRFVGDMPFVHFNPVGNDSTNAFWSYGNPYIGLEIKKPLHLFYWSVGMRLPLAPKALPDSSLIPHFSNINRWTALNYRTGSLNTLLNFHYENVSGFAIKMTGGPEFSYSKRDRTLQTYLKYVAQIRWKFNPLIIGGGFNGLLKTSRPARNIFEYYVETSIRTGSMEPGVVAIFPYDKKSKKQIHYIVGLRIRFYFDNM